MSLLQNDVMCHSERREESWIFLILLDFSLWSKWQIVPFAYFAKANIITIFFCKSEYKNLSRRTNRRKTDRKRRPAFFAAYLPSPDNSWPSHGIIFILLKHRELSRLTFGYPSCWIVAIRFQFCRSEVNWPYCKLCPNSRNVFNSKP